ncbi:membrane protein insertase YidC [Clostridium botulinum]|uniref:Membrane protein insertase YidC n=1 Tax=Clostridium botulinum TaxID=1491 RepID=A0A0C2SGI9_CLOBO|nr:MULTISPECIES: membrane protein insertase YidC [Clostridium]ACD51968.1 putative sporulation protein/membrane protein insertase, OxaA family [Clostridium botulinum E3 str. Alaska E43]AJF31133.1 protein translocase component YidC [Clostridium botulinum]AJF34195.1 protein translocase component YidC [Clostridium botulinum]KAI3347197.1 membrane protein insertase YidC [Clostridium botulinum]KIL08351.1 protein translocase component YidC [Clostridium botulinum]
MFEKIIQFMANIFNYLHDFILNLGVSDVGLSYVLAILIFTLMIRLLILPLNIKAAKSTQKMQAVQPQMKKLQEKYKGNPEKLNEEMRKFYKENDVSLTGGCLPSLLPLPILMALYYVFFRIEGMNGASFLWIKDLGARDTTMILPVLAAISTYLPSYLMTKATPMDDSPMNMGTMSLVMALMMGFMSINFKSILVLYWIIGNVIQTIQTYFLNYLPAKKKVALAAAETAVSESSDSSFSMIVEEPKNLASTKKKNKKKK